jgi:ketosteroid isomerase-like protein
MGDIYAKMASQAYNQALELNEDNPTAKAKLSLINNLFSLPAAPEPARVAAAPPPQRVVAEAAPSVQTAPAPAPEAAPAPPPEVRAEASPLPEPVATAPAEAPAAVDEVKRAVDLWATAWSSKDVAAYLRMYAQDFAPPGGDSLAAWERSRKDRIERPAFIKVDVAELSVTMLGGDHAQAVFTQSYQSDTFSDSVKKTLILKKSGERWLITQETSQ